MPIPRRIGGNRKQISLPVNTIQTFAAVNPQKKKKSKLAVIRASSIRNVNHELYYTTTLTHHVRNNPIINDDWLLLLFKDVAAADITACRIN